MSKQDGMDRRVKRTRAALREAFVDLVLSKPYDDISVNELIEKAGIGRSTFYQHYSSKDDLLASSLYGPMSIIASSILPTTTTERLEAIMQHFWEQRQFARTILDGTSRKHVLESLKSSLARNLRDYCRSQNVQCIVPMELTSATIAEAQLKLVFLWLTSTTRCSLSEITQALDEASKSLALGLTRKQR